MQRPSPVEMALAEPPGYQQYLLLRIFVTQPA